MIDRIQKIVDEYKKSTIQSEAEVRSKLIVPLIEALNYSSDLRAEEFPVYGYEGDKRLPAKNADFILFSNNQFANHRQSSSTDLDWVREHSLLVVEAKKPGKMPCILGQPQYYSIWTRSVAYLAIDGQRIRGYYYININADPKVIDCTIDELPQCSEILDFCFDRLLQVKQNSFNIIENIQSPLNGISKETLLGELDEESVQYVTEESLTAIPDNVFSYMGRCLGRDALGLTKLQLITRFLNMTDAYLANKMRYGVPEYMFSIPRGFYNARLYVDNIIFPLVSGTATEYYRGDYERFFFEDKYIQIVILLEKGKIIQFEIGYNVTDRTVTARLTNFEKVWRVLQAKSVRIAVDDSEHREFTLPVEQAGEKWPEKQETIMACTYWCDGLKQMKEIEEEYEIEFKLRSISGGDAINKLYSAIYCVYRGMKMQSNCTVCLPVEACGNKIDIEEMSLFEEGETIALPTLCIHNVEFVPYQTILLPGTYSADGDNISNTVEILCCCKYTAIITQHGDLKQPA